MIAGTQIQVPKALELCPRPLASSSGSAITCGSLPEWFLSALISLSGKEPRISRASKKIEMLPEWAQKNLISLVHVMPCYCAKSMANGELRIHKSNGTYVGIVQSLKEIQANSSGGGGDENVVLLLSCPDKTHRITRNNVPDVVKIVRKPLKNSENIEEASKSPMQVLEPENETTGCGQYSAKDGILWIMVEGKSAMQRIVKRLTEGTLNPN